MRARAYRQSIAPWVAGGGSLAPLNGLGLSFRFIKLHERHFLMTFSPSSSFVDEVAVRELEHAQHLGAIQRGVCSLLPVAVTHKCVCCSAYPVNHRCGDVRAGLLRLSPAATPPTHGPGVDPFLGDQLFA